MPRRFALAGALALTIVVTFAVIALGRSSGLLGGGSHSADDLQAARQPAAAPAQSAPATAPEPQVLTEYVYVDAPSRVGAAPPQAQSQPSSAPPPPSEPSQAPAPTVTAPPAQRPPTTIQPTEPPAPAQPAPPATPKPGPTPTAAAPQQPAMPSEIEFVGTVTAINGNMVTFSHNGATTDVQVSTGDSLAVGDRVHVHARLRNGVYVASEIEGD